MGFFKRMKDKMTNSSTEMTDKFKTGLEKTRDSFSGKLNSLVARYRTVDEDFFEELEEILIMADIGVNTVMELIEELKEEVKLRNIKETSALYEVISENTRCEHKL